LNIFNFLKKKKKLLGSNQKILEKIFFEKKKEKYFSFLKMFRNKKSKAH